MDGSVETSRPTLGPKPRLAPKPFSLQKTNNILSINTPRAFTAPSKPTNVPSGNAETLRSVPKAAQTPPQQTTAPVSGHIRDEVKTDSKTEESRNRAGASDSTAAPVKTDPVLQTPPPKESSASNAAQKEHVIQTNHKAAAESNSQQKDAKNEEDKASVQTPEESGSVSPSAANPAYQWGGTRRRLSSKLTSKFEWNGPLVCPQPTVTASTASNKDVVKKPATPPPEQSPAAPEPSKGAGNEEELIDYSGGDSIKRRISQLFDSSLRPEAATKKEEPDIKASSGGVKERIKNWVTDTSAEDPKPQVVQRTRSWSVDSPASPVGDATPKRADVQLPSPQAVTPSTKESVESPKGEAVEKPHESTTDLPGEQEQNKPVEAEVTLRHPKVSTDHAAVDEGQAGAGESPQFGLKRNNGKRRSVRFGIVETDDGAPPLILGSPSDSSSEEDPSEDKGGEDASVYRRVGKKVGESQKNEEEHEARVEVEKRLKAEEDKQARLKLEELKREDEEREKEDARRREELRRREEEKQREEEREKQRLKDQEVQRQKEEERERQRLKEEEQKRQMEKLRADKEKEVEQMRQMEERLRLEEMGRVRKEAEERGRENQRRLEEEKMKARQRQEEEERIRRTELEIRMQQEKEEEKERMRQIEKQREKERRNQLEKERVEELERRRLKDLEEKLRMEKVTTRDLISLDSKDVPQKSETLLSSVPNHLEPSENATDQVIYDDFSVKKPQIDVDFEDFSVKPKRWGSQAKVEKPPVRSWRAEPLDEDAVVPVDARRQESRAPEKVVEPDRPEPTAAMERPEEEEEEEEEEQEPVSVELEEEAEEEEEDSVDEGDSTDDESEDGEEQVNSYCVNPEDKDTDALIDTSPDQQNGFCDPTNEPDSPKSVPEHVPDVSSEDVDLTDSSTQPDFVPFPESSAPLLDNSAQRSKVALRKSQIRRAPSRSLRLAQTESQSWRVHDSTDEKNGSPKQEDSGPQGKQPKLHKASSPSTLNPAAQLIAQLKRRTSGGGAGKKEVKEEVKQREENESQQEEVAPTPVPRSPRKSAQLAGAALVLPPLGGSDGGAVSSPAWLKELKSKKRLSQHDSET